MNTTATAPTTRTTTTTLANSPLRIIGYINVLAVLLGPRPDARKTRKKDYYIQEPSSIVVSGRRRKTVLSIWRDQATFERDVKPGCILVIYGAAVNKNYEEDAAYKILRFVKGKVPHGHLNIYNDHPAHWYACEPTNVPGYGELVIWRDQVLKRELQLEEEEELERERVLKEIGDREFEAAQAQGRLEMEGLNRITKAEDKKRIEEQGEKEVEAMDKEGLIWWRNDKPFWRMDGIY
jgi:hypothetical protein